MKRVFLLCLVPLYCFALNQALTYELNGGRLGDNISTFSKAFYLSYHYKIPLLYKPFMYSDCFALHEQETFFTPQLTEQFSQIIIVKTVDDIEHHRFEDNTLFISTFYTKTPWLYQLKNTDQTFKELIEHAFTPRIICPEIDTPNHGKTVALHLRRGGGFDAPLYSQQWYSGHEALTEYTYKIINSKKVAYADQQWPTKFPPLQYYLDQLKKLRSLVPADISLLVYLCTDDPEPAQLVNEFKIRLNEESITFMYRDSANMHDRCVVEDLIILSRCNYMIRSGSLFSQAAQLLGSHQIILSPLHTCWENDKLIIDKVLIIKKEQP